MMTRLPCRIMGCRGAPAAFREGCELRCEFNPLSGFCSPVLRTKRAFLSKPPLGVASVFCHCERSVVESCHCEPAKQSLFYLFASCGKARPPRYARRPTVIASLRSNLSCPAFVVFLSLRACEAISLLSVCWLWKGEIATYLAMTRNSSLRSNLSFLYLPALNNRDRFVPRDDNAFLAMTEGAPTSEIATLRSPSYCHCEPAKQSRFYLFAGCGKARSPRTSR